LIVPFQISARNVAWYLNLIGYMHTHTHTCTRARARTHTHTHRSIICTIRFERGIHHSKRQNAVCNQVIAINYKIT